jgi:hypothetical protein
MTMFQFLKSIRQELKRSALTVVIVGTAVVLRSECVTAEEPLVTKVGRFEIPFDIEAEPGKRPEGFAVLFSSQDGGSTWEKLSTVPAVSESFTFTAPRDGHYSFAIRTTDAQGNLQQAIQGSAPELEIVVDTVSPDIQLDLLDGGNGQVLVNWVLKDASVAAQTLSIEFADGTDGRWKPVRFVPAVNGQAAIQCAGSSVVSVRAAVRDVAGNQGEKSTQLVLRNGGVVTNTVPSNSYPQSNAPALGPSPFARMNAATDQTSGAYGLTLPSNSAGTFLPDSPFAAAEVPKIQAGSSTGNILQIPGGSTPALNFATPAASYDLPGPGMLKEASYQSAAGPQVIKHHIFDLEYQVDDVGPSGVSAVELFVTEDGGQHWFTYGNDDDLRSPVLIDTRGEGTFGFAVRVRNGLGFADDPPQPGQAPEMVVVVDESLPVIELAQPTMRTDGFGTIQLSWQVRDKNPASTPVRLEYAAAPNGPWTPVFDWQFDQSNYQWGVRPGTPTQLYFRLLARDAAGNVASAQTTQAVVVDLRRPVGRLLRVQAVSQPGNRN